jgi:hypothetical protein
MTSDQIKAILEGASDNILNLDNGTKIEANKIYKVAGWATVNSQADGDVIWGVVANYLRNKKQFPIDKMNIPKLHNMAGNKGHRELSSSDIRRTKLRRKVLIRSFGCRGLNIQHYLIYTNQMV